MPSGHRSLSYRHHISKSPNIHRFKPNAVPHRPLQLITPGYVWTPNCLRTHGYNKVCYVSIALVDRTSVNIVVLPAMHTAKIHAYWMYMCAANRCHIHHSQAISSSFSRLISPVVQAIVCCCCAQIAPIHMPLLNGRRTADRDQSTMLSSTMAN